MKERYTKKTTHWTLCIIMSKDQFQINCLPHRLIWVLHVCAELWLRYLKRLAKSNQKCCHKELLIHLPVRSNLHGVVSDMLNACTRILHYFGLHNFISKLKIWSVLCSITLRTGISRASPTHLSVQQSNPTSAIDEPYNIGVLRLESSSECSGEHFLFLALPASLYEYNK